MLWVKETGGVPIKSWCDDIESGAWKQALDVAALPFAYRHVALMADCHQGYGMPIGGVLAANGVVVPNAVGVDIGCGMCAVRTDILHSIIKRDEVKKIMGKARDLIPVGFRHHETPQEWEGFKDAPDIPVVEREKASAKKQLGTLGGGNHFIELQAGSDGMLWLMVHSGSRNFGYMIAAAYHKKAKGLCEKFYSFLSSSELAFLPIEFPEAREYFAGMNFALSFAKASRAHMMDVLLKIVYDVVSAKEEERVDIHHNFAAWENHFNKNVIIHRKGATSARSGQLGVIPGSQGTSSYIIRGKGNPESFNSCSHGAGRVMGRNQARAKLDLKEQRRLLDEKGIVHSIRTTQDLDEAPGAYKDINMVMKNQEDLVCVIVESRPLGVIKA